MHDPDEQIPFEATDAEVPLYALVAELNATSVRERLDVIVGVRRPDAREPMLRMIGPTGWRHVRFAAEGDVSAIERVRRVADGFVAEAREHHAARAA